MIKSFDILRRKSVSKTNLVYNYIPEGYFSEIEDLEYLPEIENPDWFDDIEPVTRIESSIIEYINKLKVKVPKHGPLNAIDIKAIDITQGYMVTEDKVIGSICDPRLCPDGFMLILPKEVYVDIDNKNFKAIKEIFIPEASIRKYWQHSSGQYSVDTMGKALNYVIYCSQFNLDRLEIAVGSYFSTLIKFLSTKNGRISQLGLSIRYPYSAKATATLSIELPDNTVEIHTNMANQLGVKTGDVVLIERFPCLGFMSIRPQYVQVTDDEQCRFTIRSSNNCLCSLNLDFDGDTLYIASFKTDEANHHLKQLLISEELSYTNQITNKINNKKVPHFMDGGFDVCSVVTFPALTKQEHNKIVKRATGVKAHTGPVIALSYNLMRIVERCVPHDERKTHADIEILLDTLGNSVFSQKHGIRSLQEEATDAICMANPEKMFELGFEESSSKILCEIIKTEAKKILGITNLVSFHKNAKANGKSNIINKIIRTAHKLYFTSRSILSPKEVYEGTQHDCGDVPSFLFKDYKKDITMVEGVNTTTKCGKIKDILSHSSS